MDTMTEALALSSIRQERDATAMVSARLAVLSMCRAIIMPGPYLHTIPVEGPRNLRLMAMRSLRYKLLELGLCAADRKAGDAAADSSAVIALYIHQKYEVVS